MSMPHTCRCGTCGREMDYGLRLGEDFSSLFGVSAHPQAVCCHKCNNHKTSTFMITCKTCGNKRCPKASDHTLECTNSNDPGQAGSIY